MRHNIVRNWVESAELMTKKSFIVIPFLVLGFLEALALELIYFSPGFPLMRIANPLVEKFFGEPYVHYPANFIVLPQIFYYAQIALFVVIGAFLYSITVDLVTRIGRDTPLKARNIIEDSIRRYAPCFLYAILIAVASVFAKKYSLLAFGKLVKLASVHIPEGAVQALPFGASLSVLIGRICVNVFFILIIPLIVIKKRFFIVALLESVFRGAGNFLSIFIMIFVPYLLYVPIVLLKSFPGRLMGMMSPEIIFPLTLASIFIGKLVECFVIICASRFLLDRERFAGSEGPEDGGGGPEEEDEPEEDPEEEPESEQGEPEEEEPEDEEELELELEEEPEIEEEPPKKRRKAKNTLKSGKNGRRRAYV